MKTQILKFAEWSTAILLTLAVLVLLIARAQHAGGLWRDELILPLGETLETLYLREIVFVKVNCIDVNANAASSVT